MPEHFYTGLTDNVKLRLQKYNGRTVLHTSKFKPWHLKTYIAFANNDQAVRFEKYLKSPSGRAFAKKRL